MHCACSVPPSSNITAVFNQQPTPCIPPLLLLLVPQAGVNADALSHDDYLNAPGESYTAKFDTAGEYGYFCEPHQGAGMVGKVIVQ